MNGSHSDPPDPADRSAGQTLSAATRLGPDREGRVSVRLLIYSFSDIRVVLATEAGVQLNRVGRMLKPGPHQIDFASTEVAPWQPAGLGERPLYQLRVLHYDDDGDSRAIFDQLVGFKDAQPLPSDGPPTYRINGRAVALAAADWQAAGAGPLAGRIDALAAAGVNLLRLPAEAGEDSAIWDACDRAGVLIEQALPTGEAAARALIRRRRHRASRLRWSGREALRPLAAEEDPGVEFVAR